MGAIHRAEDSSHGNFVNTSVMDSCISHRQQSLQPTTAGDAVASTQMLGLTSTHRKHASSNRSGVPSDCPPTSPDQKGISIAVFGRCGISSRTNRTGRTRERMWLVPLNWNALASASRSSFDISKTRDSFSTTRLQVGAIPLDLPSAVVQTPSMVLDKADPWLQSMQRAPKTGSFGIGHAQTLDEAIDLSLWRAEDARSTWWCNRRHCSSDSWHDGAKGRRRRRRRKEMAAIQLQLQRSAAGPRTLVATIVTFVSEQPETGKMYVPKSFRRAERRRLLERDLHLLS
jgi:hypothetical protein